jgi:hypothetical protein
MLALFLARLWRQKLGDRRIGPPSPPNQMPNYDLRRITYYCERKELAELVVAPVEAVERTVSQIGTIWWDLDKTAADEINLFTRLSVKCKQITAS